jgi:tRNA(Ile)-lysidine synthase
MNPVLAALRSAAETELMPRGARILLAVSGGADSLALLYGASELAPPMRWRLSVAHVQHGWRGREAERDLAFVADHARRLALAFASRRVDARGESRRLRLSPEAGARHVRYAALAEMARELRASRIATAHQRDDVIESLLIAKQRKAGISRLAGPRTTRDDGVVRPLLEVSKGEILAYLQDRGLAYRRDASNGDLRLLRNRIRRQLSAERNAGTSTAEALAEQAQAFRRERDRLDQDYAERILPGLRIGPWEALADAALLQASSAELQRRALEQVALPFARPGRPPMTGREREQLLQRIGTGADFRFEAGRQVRFVRRGRVLRVRRAAW